MFHLAERRLAHAASHDIFVRAAIFDNPLLQRAYAPLRVLTRRPPCFMVLVRAATQIHIPDDL